MNPLFQFLENREQIIDRYDDAIEMMYQIMIARIQTIMNEYDWFVDLIRDDIESRNMISEEFNILREFFIFETALHFRDRLRNFSGRWRGLRGNAARLPTEDPVLLATINEAINFFLNLEANYYFLDGRLQQLLVNDMDRLTFKERIVNYIKSNFAGIGR